MDNLIDPGGRRKAQKKEKTSFSERTTGAASPPALPIDTDLNSGMSFADVEGESARAGEAGLGFSVVAEEVRALALKSATAAHHSAELIERAKEKADRGVQLNEKVLRELVDNVAKVKEVRQVIAEITELIQQLNQGIRHIDSGLDQTNAVTQRNAAASEESATTAMEMSRNSDRMRDLVAAFKKALDELAGVDDRGSETASYARRGQSFAWKRPVAGNAHPSVPAARGRLPCSGQSYEESTPEPIPRQRPASG